MYLYLLLFFFLYCYPIARATVALERRFTVQMMPLGRPTSRSSRLKDVHKSFAALDRAQGRLARRR